jgi:carboxyl-terminal processing protease
MKISPAALLGAAAVFAVGCSGFLLGPSPGTGRAAVFDELWSEFDLHYSFFQFKAVNWDTLGATYRPRALAAKTDEEFASQIGAMMRELKDVHVSLTTAGAGSTLGYVSPFDTIATYYDPASTLQHYVPYATTTTGQHLKYGFAAPAVGYVRIPSFEGSEWAGEMDEAIGAMPQAASLIVDVRDNRGGNEALAIRIAGRFTTKTLRYGWVRLRDGPLHSDFSDYIEETVAPVGARRFRGAVYVLTNRRDFSSAEDFVLAMRAIPRVTVIGDTTAGASGGPILRELANGWNYELSEWIEYLPGKRMFEGIGLAPDVFVRAKPGDAASGVDAAMKRSLELAQESSP